MEDTIDVICADLKALVMTNLQTIKTSQDKIPPKDKVKQPNMPLNDCDKLFESFGRKIVRECLTIQMTYRTETDAKIDKLTKQLAQANEELIQVNPLWLKTL